MRKFAFFTQLTTMAGRSSRYGFLLTVLSLLTFAQSPAFAQQGPLERYGRLRVNGGSSRILSEGGTPVQLRGMSSHGLHWEDVNLFTPSSIKALATGWNCNVVRAALYVNEGGYATKNEDGKRALRSKINMIVNEAEANGMYALIDWHVLSEQDPNKTLTEAKTFFGIMSRKYKGKKNVLYEICNEPNGNTSWADIKRYAEQIIPVIRENDKNAIIIVGTPQWSQRVEDAARNPIKPSMAYNVMYTLHFYAVTHRQNDFYEQHVKYALGKIPLFVTEWGTCEASGNGAFDKEETRKWLNFLDENQISWVNWNFSDKNETSSALKPGSKANQAWYNTTESGTYVRYRIGNPNTPTTNRVAAGAAHPMLAATMQPEAFPAKPAGLYPNPALASSTISYQPAEVPAGTRIELFDQKTGRQVYTHVVGTATQITSLDLSPLAPGTYVVRFTPVSGKSWEQRFVKQ